jgi:hypothetical protein
MQRQPPLLWFVWETYSLNDLEEDYTQEAVDLGTFLVCTSHLRLHSAGESARGLECAGNDEDAREEQPEMSMVGREGV